MHQRQDFEDSWPALECQLREALARRRIPPDAREDILQETALRLLKNWDRIRPDSLWAFALTVALNVVRDEARRKVRRDRVVLDGPRTEMDPEHEALVRLELDRVRSALASMTERQRAIILAEVGEGGLIDPSTPALKMARMRARRRLRALIEGVAGYAAVPVVRARRWLQDPGVGVANTAASLAVQIATLVALSGISIPAELPSQGALHANRAGPAVAATDGTTTTRPNERLLTERVSSAAETLLHPSLSRGGNTSRRQSDSDLNEHFGFVHAGDDGSITVEDEARIGPYGAGHSVTQVIAGSRVAAKVRARYDAAPCVNAFLARPHAPCGDLGAARGRLRTEVNEKRAEAEVDTTQFN